MTRTRKPSYKKHPISEFLGPSALVMAHLPVIEMLENSYYTDASGKRVYCPADDALRAAILLERLVYWHHQMDKEWVYNTVSTWHLQLHIKVRTIEVLMDWLRSLGVLVAVKREAWRVGTDDSGKATPERFSPLWYQVDFDVLAQGLHAGHIEASRDWRRYFLDLGNARTFEYRANLTGDDGGNISEVTINPADILAAERAAAYAPALPPVLRRAAATAAPTTPPTPTVSAGAPGEAPAAAAPVSHTGETGGGGVSHTRETYKAKGTEQRAKRESPRATPVRQFVNSARQARAEAAPAPATSGPAVPTLGEIDLSALVKGSGPRRAGAGDTGTFDADLRERMALDEAMTFKDSNPAFAALVNGWVNAQRRAGRTLNDDQQFGVLVLFHDGARTLGLERMEGVLNVMRAENKGLGYLQGAINNARKQQAEQKGQQAPGGGEGAPTPAQPARGGRKPKAAPAVPDFTPEFDQPL